MGASLSWYAVRGKARESVLQDFGLRLAGEEGGDSPYLGASLPNRWYLVTRGRHEFTDEEMERVSHGCEAVACFVEEHVMVSRAAHWRDGREVWSVRHDSQEDALHLDVRGEPPVHFQAIRDRMTKEQEEDDGCDFIFDIPLTLAAELTGYRYDQTPDLTYEALERPSLLQRLFRR